MERAKIKKAAEEAKYQKKKAAFEAEQAKAAKEKVRTAYCATSHNNKYHRNPKPCLDPGPTLPSY